MHGEVREDFPCELYNHDIVLILRISLGLRPRLSLADILEYQKDERDVICGVLVETCCKHWVLHGLVDQIQEQLALASHVHRQTVT